MVVQDERDKYIQYDVFQFPQVERNESTQVDSTYSTSISSNIDNIFGNRI